MVIGDDEEEEEAMDDDKSLRLRMMMRIRMLRTVSYTHLTLPTILLV